MKNTMTGNRALFKVDGQIVGSGVQNVDFNDDHGLQDVDGIGSAFTQELVPGKASYSITLSQYFISGKNLIASGIVPDAKELLTSGLLEIELIDNVTGATLEHYTGARTATHSRQYGKHAISGENATFRAMNKLK
jgi:hypothetical protein